MTEPLQPPSAAHRLVDQPVGLIIPDKELAYRVEIQSPAEFQGAHTHVHYRRTVVAVVLIEGKMHPCSLS